MIFFLHKLEHIYTFVCRLCNGKNLDWLIHYLPMTKRERERERESEKQMEEDEYVDTIGFMTNR